MALRVDVPHLQMPHMGGIDLPSSPPRYEGSCGPSRQRSPEACVQEVAPMPQTGRAATQCMQSPPQVGSASLEGFNKRKAAADWIEQISGVSVAYETDQAFRAALRDGVVLCSLVDAVCPGSGAKVVHLSHHCTLPESLQQRSDNLSTFIRAAQAVVPPQALLTVDDLECDALEERMRVVDTILYLRQAHQASSAYAASSQPLRASHHASPLGSAGASGYQQQHVHLQEVGSKHQLTPQNSAYSAAPSSSPLTDAFAANTAARAASQALALPQQNGLSLAGPRSSAAAAANYYSSSQSIQSAHIKGVQAAAGVTRLMQQCTAMLRERMFVDAAPRASPTRFPAASPVAPDMAMEGIGPVLEGVLGSLTQEYEKRLLAKDHELAIAREQVAHLQQKVVDQQAQVNELSTVVQQRAYEAEVAVASTAAADTAALQDELASKRAHLAHQEEELQRLRAAADDSGQLLAQREALLRGELAALQGQLQVLEDIDAKYRRVVEENRKLYNQVQDLRGNIRVFCRLRPVGATGDPTPSCIDVGLEGDLAVYDTLKNERRMFRVDRVFDEGADQVAVYDDTQPLIRSVLDGYNVCIFAYGQTGSGKTHTMCGTNVQNLAGRGINYRALDDLFAIRDARIGEVDYQISVQMLEIYNETLRDLLCDDRTGSNRLDILNTQASGCNVPNATKFNVYSSADVEKIMACGAANRHTSETKMNDRSSRSHQILTVLVEGQHLITGGRSHGCLHLIDLAGSERVGKSEASGDRLVEAQHINRSLSALGDVMAALASKSQHIPFRNSKLTQLLADSLCGQAKVMMFMHISPESNMVSESVSTLKFASRVSEITLGQARRNVESGKVFEAHEQLAQLQREVASKEAQLQEHSRALEAERSFSRTAAGERDMLLNEARELRSQLEAARAALALAQRQQPQQLPASFGSTSMAAAAAGMAGPLHQQRPPTAGSSPAPVPRLPLAAAAAAAAASGSSALAEQQQQQRQQQQQQAGVVSPAPAAGGFATPSRAGSSTADALGGVRLDGTPVRDQNAGASGAGLAAFTPRTEKSELSLTTPRTSRSHYTPSSAPKEVGAVSSQKHIDRLQSARLRQSGVFSGSGAADSLRSSVASSASGFHTHRPATASGCRVTSAAAMAGSSPAASGSLTARSRTSYSVTGPAGAAAGKPPSGSLTARGVTSAYTSRPLTARVSSAAPKAPVPRAPSATSSNAGPGAGLVGASGAVTSRATSRGGGRWK